MPTVSRVAGYRFFFFSLEGKEPPHVHVEQAEKYAKLWLDPVAIVRSRGFRSHELSEIMRIVRENRQIFREKWDEHFGR
ncbi:MAG: DUF4160 domain-containing protein [Acidobacteriales bacterium]|nr:MAG: DUF4160 domain-containing protein [Terriglobales bacterium]